MKVNFSYWLLFLLLSQASYMSVSIFSFFFSLNIFVLSLTLKTRLNHSLLSTTRTESLCQDHHKESLDCRSVRSFVSIHHHQQHHSHQKHWMCHAIFSHSRTAARDLSSKEQNFDTSVTALVYIKSLSLQNQYSLLKELNITLNQFQVFLTYRVT
jgi:hypothetical protein